jgi:hypothetical protein
MCYVKGRCSKVQQLRLKRVLNLTTFYFLELHHLPLKVTVEDQKLCTSHVHTSAMCLGCVTAQAVSRWLPTVDGHLLTLVLRSRILP